MFNVRAIFRAYSTGAPSRHRAPGAAVTPWSRLLGRTGTALLLTVLMLPFASTAADAAVPALTGGYEIDGDKPVNQGGIDAGGLTARVDGANDNTQYDGNGKEDRFPGAWGQAGASSPAASDIINAWSDNQIYAGALWAYFAFDRGAVNGSFTLDVELNQAANLSDTPAQPNRTPGDLLIVVGQHGNDPFTVDSVLRWTVQTAALPAGCDESSGYPAGQHYGWCPVTLPATSFAAATGENGSFAEVAINLSSLFPATTCVGNFGHANLRSRASNSPTADLKDYVQSIPIKAISTCPQAKIRKVNSSGDLLTGATFTIAKDPTPGSARLIVQVTDGLGADATLTPARIADADATPGVIGINPASPGTYTVTETVAPAGYWLPEQRSQTLVLAPGAGNTGELTFTDPDRFEKPTVVKTAAGTYDVSYAWKIAKSVADDTLNVPEGTPATADYSVTLEAGAQSRTHHQVAGTITVTNPNRVAMRTTFTDTLGGVANCTLTRAGSPLTDADAGTAGFQVDLAPGTGVISYICSFPGTTTPPAGTNVAAFTWSRATYPMTQGQVDDPAGAGTGTASGSADYTWRAASETDKTVTVTDTRHQWTPQWTATWSDGFSETRTYSLPFDGVPGTCKDYDNTATVTGSTSGVLDSADATVTVCVGKDLTVSKNAPLSYHRTYNWDIAKRGPGTVWAGDDGNGGTTGTASYEVTVKATGYTDSNQVVVGKITVHNPNDWAMTAHVSDKLNIDGVDVTCTVTNGGTAVVPANGNLVLDYTCTGIKQGDYVGNNTATVTWDKALYFTPTGKDEFVAAVVATQDAAPTNNTITVTDEMTGFAGRQWTLDWNDVWARPGHEQVLSYDRTLSTQPGECTPYTNTAAIEEIDGESATVTTQACAPGVEKTVDATYGVNRLWQVEKSVDESRVEVGPTGSHRFTYVVKAIPSGSADGVATWNGTITVSNPATTPLTVDVADLSGVAGWTCRIDGEDTATIAAGAEVTLDYTCTGGAGTRHPDGTNTAKVSYVGKSVSTEVPVAWKAETAGNETITVHDTFDPDGDLGTATWNADGTPTSFTYTWTSPGDGTPGACKSYTNTATVPGDTDSETVAVCTEKPLELVVDAAGSYDRAYHWAITKVAGDQSPVEIPAGGSHFFDYDVAVRATGSTDSGWETHGTITVTNANSYPEGDITATVTDKLDGITGGVCVVDGGADVVIGHGQVVVLDYTCTFAGAPADRDYTGTSVATAHWTDPEGDDATASGTSGEFTMLIDQELDKTITVYDDQLGADPIGTATYPNGFERHYSLERTGTAGTCTTYPNTAWIDLPSTQRAVDQSASEEVELCVEKRLVVTKTATGTKSRTYAWDVDKAADQTTLSVDPATGKATAHYKVIARALPFTDSRYALSGVITVMNPNAYAAGSITATVADVPVDLAGGAVCSLVGEARVTIGPGARAEIGYSCTFTSTPAESGGTNSATATWTPPGAGTTTTESGSAPVTFAVTNRTNETVRVVDDKTNPGTEVVLDPSLTWAQGLVRTYEYDLQLAGTQGRCAPYTNTAWVESVPNPGSGPGPVLDSDTATVTVCWAMPVGLAQEARGSKDRTFPWRIDKVASATRIDAAAGSASSITYTVTATPGAAIDSGWEMSGSVRLTNPNDFTSRTVTLAQSTAVGGPTACTFTGGNTVTLAPSQVVTKSFTCQLTGSSYTDGSSTVSATWDGGGNGTASAPVAFALDTVTNQTVTVTDDRTVPGTSTVLGQATWSAALTPVVFTYALPVTMPGACQTLTNTGTIVSTGQTDTASVVLCPTQVGGAGGGGGGGVKGNPPTHHGNLPSTGAAAGTVAVLVGGAVTTLLGIVLLGWQRRRPVTRHS